MVRLIGLLWLVVATAASAVEMSRQQQTLLLSLVGDWHGTMELVDQQGKSQQQQTRLRVKARQDMRSLSIERHFRHIDQTDSLVISSLGQPAKMVYRSRDNEQTFYSRTSNMQVLSADSWVLVQEHQAIEQHRPATVRFTLQRNGSELSSTKEIDFADDKYTFWQVRYKSRYQQLNPTQ
ncbi:hypothetical protein [Ferrimonas lipolytica]|uniref:DUF1579 domain-containing protein n=1 Tax=Ferrimonas lipolytica TaxID=2724191 RepID=A0A6H1UBH7_9GAMM|nr:hypothetical protein [Ferrimonas lipolytica]QIZ76411.1 hypothetical protein HER31_05775 [Ferrimonas lipolytica]